MAISRMTLLMGLWIVTIGTVPLYIWFKMWKRKVCSHEYENHRFCNKCGKREKQVVV